jgi:hypothetical protein
MGPISAEVEVDAPREAAFALISDFGSRPSFTDHFMSDFHLTRIDSVGLGAGARFRVNAPLRSPWMDTEIVAMEEPFRIEERGQGGRVNRIANHTVWEMTGGESGLTVVSVAHWTEPHHPVDRAVEALSAGALLQAKSWRRTLQRLRDILEGEDPRGERIAIAGGNRYATGIP